MNALEIWIAIVGMTLVTLLTRTLVLIFGDRLPLPERLQHALRFAPACALAALIAPELLADQGTVLVSMSNAKLVGGSIAIAVMLVTRSMLATMTIGMAAYMTVRNLG
jgi:branched-subunit amino acid transport protein